MERIMTAHPLLCLVSQRATQYISKQTYNYLFSFSTKATFPSCVLLSYCIEMEISSIRQPGMITPLKESRSPTSSLLTAFLVGHADFGTSTELPKTMQPTSVTPSTEDERDKLRPLSSFDSPVCVSSHHPTSAFSPIVDLGGFYEQATWRMYQRIQLARHELHLQQVHDEAPSFLPVLPSMDCMDEQGRRFTLQRRRPCSLVGVVGQHEPEDELEDDAIFEMEL